MISPQKDSVMNIRTTFVVHTWSVECSAHDANKTNLYVSQNGTFNLRFAIAISHSLSHIHEALSV